MLSSSTINKVLSSTTFIVLGDNLPKVDKTASNMMSATRIITCLAIQGFEFSFPRFFWFFCFLFVVFFCYNHSFQNRNCVFEEALGLLIRFKLYVLKTEFSITYIGETMIFSSIMHIDNLHIILISKKVFYIKKRLLKYEWKRFYDQLTLF